MNTTIDKPSNCPLFLIFQEPGSIVKTNMVYGFRLGILTFSKGFRDDLLLQCRVSEGLRWQTVSVVSFILAKFLSSKRVITARKKIESKFPVDMHIYMVSPSKLQSFRKFCWAVSEGLRWQTVSVVSFILAKFQKVQKGSLLPEKKIKSEFPINISGFRGVPLTNCFSSIFHFSQISTFKKGVNPRKKNCLTLN